jgi:hypothetical protein
LLLDRVLHVTNVHIPFFTSDHLPEYRQALLHAYGMQQTEPRGIPLASFTRYVV